MGGREAERADKPAIQSASWFFLFGKCQNNWCDVRATERRTKKRATKDKCTFKWIIMNFSNIFASHNCCSKCQVLIIKCKNTLEIHKHSEIRVFYISTIKVCTVHLIYVMCIQTDSNIVKMESKVALQREKSIERQHAVNGVLFCFVSFRIVWILKWKQFVRSFVCYSIRF